MKHLRDKMYNWESDPPPSTWDRVRAALDESELASSFPSKLREMELAAPAGAWSAIESELNESDAAAAPAAPVVVMRSRMRWMRYAAAVLVLAAIGLGIRYFSTGQEDTLAVTPPPVPADTNTAIASEPKPTNNLPTPGAHVNDDSLRNMLASVETPVRRVTPGNEEVRFASEANRAYAEELESSFYIDEDHRPRIAENYVTLLTPDGSFIRMSKKWSDLLCCIAGEDPNAACNMQIKAWQDQLAESPVAPAPGNFMDLLELVLSVSEGTQL